MNVVLTMKTKKTINNITNDSDTTYTVCCPPKHNMSIAKLNRTKNFDHLIIFFRQIANGAQSGDGCHVG
jgi:hypothetical protein